MANLASGISLLRGSCPIFECKLYMEALKELVFEPAGMMSTCCTGDRDRANIAIGKPTNGPTHSALEHLDAGFYGFQ